MFTKGETIGIIGTGLMGAAMAERLLAAGFRVLGWDRDVARLAASASVLASVSETVAAASNPTSISLTNSRRSMMSLICAADRPRSRSSCNRAARSDCRVFS